MQTKTVGLTTAQAVDMEIRRAEIEQREISDGTARAIADSFHDGSIMALSFVSTGTIADRADLWRTLFPDYPHLSAHDRIWADWLGTYIVNRPDCNAVDGWANLWAD